METAGQTFFAFILGSVGTVLGTVISFYIFGKHLGSEGPQICAALCASYIGGSVNFAAVTAGLGISSRDIVAAAMTADNIAMACYISVLMALSCRNSCRQFESTSTAGSDVDSMHAPVTSGSVSMALAAAMIVCASGSYISMKISQPSLMLAISSVLASFALPLVRLISATVGRITQSNDNRGHAFSGATSLAGALMTIFFCTIGAQAGSFKALQGSGILFSFIFVQLAVQLGVTLSLGSLFGIPLARILIASNANVGGPATAAAMAISKGWNSLVQPALLTGCFGYAIANSVGMSIAHVLQTFI